MTIQPICRIEGCERPLCAKQLCRLHWERQHRTGSTDDPQSRRGSRSSTWKGDAATYGAVHLRMSSRPRPSRCSECGTAEGRFEWALRPDAPVGDLLTSAEGYRYSVNPEHYVNLCKTCHNRLDLGSDKCRQGHPMAGDNLYVQPSNGKRFCRQCQRTRRRARYGRERTARFEHGQVA